MKIRVGVIGSDGGISGDVIKISEGIGRDIARRDCVLICGGRGGVMEAVCRGSKGEGGIVVGILPFLDKRDANPYVDIALTTGMSHARNALVVSSSDVVIVINGRVGTLSEIGLALSYNKPVVAVKGSGGVADSIGGEIKKMGIGKKVHCTGAKDAVSLALSLVK
ncbi:MAG: TIGR00725 family protein [Candidatus Altiarchaeota archaeon]|nr:TIGR00725 family protein [Candidatus Altiarchaeota archaeon]